MYSLLCLDVWLKDGDLFEEEAPKIPLKLLRFSAKGDLSLGDGQGVLKIVAVTYSKKASN